MIFTPLNSVLINDAGEIVTKAARSATTNAEGAGSIVLDTPDDSGRRAWVWQVELPDGETPQFALTWGAGAAPLAALLAADASRLTPNVLASLLASLYSLNNAGDADWVAAGVSAVPDGANLIPDAPVDGVQYARQDGAWAAVAASDTPALSAVWVAKHGSNANSGLSDTLPKLTIGAAITAASALITAGATAVRVEVLDGGDYAESITVPANIHIHARGATLRGEVALSAGAEVYLDRQYATANNQNLVSLDAAADGPAIYSANVLDGRPYTGVQNVRNIGGGGKNLFTRIGICYVGTSGVGYGDTSSGFGHIHIENEDLYLAGEGAVGIVATATGANTANIVGVIHHIIPIIPAPASTTAISMSNANAVVKLVVAEIVATVAYVITAGGLYLNCGKITGTQTGTPLFLPEAAGTAAALVDDLSGVTNQATARTNLGATTVGGALFTLANPSAIRFPRINTDNTVSALSAADTRTALQLGTMAMEVATNYHATSAFSAAPTAAEPLKADGNGGINFDTDTLVVNGTSQTVGVGIAAPGAKLHAKGSTTANTELALAITNSANTALFNVANDGRVAVGTKGTQPCAFQVNEGAYNGTYVMILVSSTNTTLGLEPGSIQSNVANFGIGANSNGAAFTMFSPVNWALTVHDNRAQVGRLSTSAPSGQFDIWCNDAARVAAVVVSAAAQTANLQQWSTSAQAILAAVTAAGTLELGQQATTSHEISGKLRSSTTANTQAARVAWAWVDNTHATRKAALTLYASDQGGERTGVTVGANGTEATLGFYGVTATARQLLATGAGATVDQVITALQNLGLLKQA